MFQIISLLLLAGALQACSAVKLAYNQAPDLAYWYLDGYLDLDGAQSVQVKDDLAALQRWHRQTQLPGYIETLQTLQRQLPADISAAQACTVLADVRSKLLALADQAEPAAAALAGTLTARQLALLERKFSSGNVDYRDHFLEGTPQARRKKRYQQAISRAEMLYGTLEDKQLGVIGQSVDRSGTEAATAYAERLRRQQDTLQSLRAVTASRSLVSDSPDKARLQVRALLERSITSPNPAYRRYLDGLTQQSCQALADLHNSTSVTQRSQAVDTLRRYERDLRALLARVD